MMKESFELLEERSGSTPDMTIHLEYQQRQKSRYKAVTDCGEQLGWFIERGRVLEDGDLLACSDGSVVKVVAANEEVSEVCSDDRHLLTRAAYHLGNRHVPLQIGEGWLRYQRDHVLDQMLQGLGLEVVSAMKPFHPENGAYHGGGHHHHHHE